MDPQDGDASSSSDVIFEVPERREGMIFSFLMQQEAAPMEEEAVEIIDFEDAHAEMQQQWMRVYTNNVANGKVIDPDQYPEEIWRHLMLIQDVKGYLLLHHAVRKKASLETIEWLMGGENDVLTLSHKAAGGSLPIHVACRSNPNFEVVKLVSKDSNGRNFLNVPDKDGNFPLDLVGEGDGIAENRVVHFLVENSPAVHEFTASMFEELLNDDKGDREEIFKALDSICNNCPPKKFQRIVRSNLKSRVCIEWLTWSFCQRNVIFTVMRDFYCQMAWIAILLHESNLYLHSESPDNFVYALYVLAAVFLAKELRQLRRYVRADVLIAYVNGIWNWVDWMTITLVISSAVTLQLVDPVDHPHDDAIRILLMATFTCQVIHFASFLKKIFLPFATFVGGLASVSLPSYYFGCYPFLLCTSQQSRLFQQVFKTIVPFMVCSALVLLAFAFMYFVTRFEEVPIASDRLLVTRDGSDADLDFSTIWQSFMSTFHMFINSPERTTNLLDALFGIITNIILLNVVIAVVSIAWDKSSEEEKAQQVFWEYRLTFIQDINLSHKARETSRRSLSAGHSGSHRLSRSKSKAQERSTGGSRNPGLRLHIQYALQYAIYFVLGFFSFGLLWPSKIKRDIFGIRFKDVVDSSKAERLETTQYRETVTNHLNELDNKVHHQIGDNRLLIKENQSLNKKIDRLEVSIEKLEGLLTKLISVDSSGSDVGSNDAHHRMMSRNELPHHSKGIRQSNRHLPFLPDEDGDDDERLHGRPSPPSSEPTRPSQSIRHVRPAQRMSSHSSASTRPSDNRRVDSSMQPSNSLSMLPPISNRLQAANRNLPNTPEDDDDDDDDEPLNSRSSRQEAEGIRPFQQSSRRAGLAPLSDWRTLRTSNPSARRRPSEGLTASSSMQPPPSMRMVDEEDDPAMLTRTSSRQSSEGIQQRPPQRTPSPPGSSDEKANVKWT